MQLAERKPAAWLNPKETAIAIRKVLKANFPTTKFSVTTARGSMVSSVDIRWIDGPTTARVDELVACFEAGSFDGMTDMYEYDRSRFVEIDGTVYRPGCRYVSTERRVSADLANRCIAHIAQYYGDVTEVPVAVQGSYCYELEPKGICNKPPRADMTWGMDYTWSHMIHQAAENRAKFTHKTHAHE